MGYKHLCLSERHYIGFESKLGKSFNKIASDLGRSQSTISSIGNCRPNSAIIMELDRRLGCPGMDFDPDAEIMEEISLLTPIYGGMHYD